MGPSSAAKIGGRNLSSTAVTPPLFHKEIQTLCLTYNRIDCGFDCLYIKRSLHKKKPNQPQDWDGKPRALIDSRVA